MRLTPDQLEALGYVETSPGIWARPPRRLAALPPALPQPAPGRPLEPQPPGRPHSPEGVVRGDRRNAPPCAQDAPRRVGGRKGGSRQPTVTLVVHRRRLLPDHDNLVGGCKHLRDAIADWLGLDDADALVRWEYAQVPTQGPEGVAVAIALP